MDMLTVGTKEEAKALLDFATLNGSKKAKIVKLSDCYLVILFA